jgi:amino acid permease
MGVGVLSMPYAMALSGAAGVASLLLCCTLFCISGKCVAWAMELMPLGVPNSYPQLGHEALGTAGQRLVTSLAIVDLSCGSVLLMMVLWNSIEVCC